jgi:ABC-type spermidine/putrescine transport system permease subunit II
MPPRPRARALRSAKAALLTAAPPRLPLDDIVKAMRRCFNPKLARSGIHRCLQPTSTFRPISTSSSPLVWLSTHLTRALPFGLLIILAVFNRLDPPHGEAAYNFR